MTAEPPPIIEVTVAAPVEAVWDALRDPKKIRHWHGWDFEENGGLDGEIDLIYQQNFVADEATHTLNVQGGDVFELEAHEGGTRIRLTRAPHGADPNWEQYYDDITEGWITFLHQLRFRLERQPDRDRRTVFHAATGQAGSPVDLLGLTEVARSAPGAAFRLPLAGQDITGTLWFRSAHQVGLTVDQWGEGLLVLSHTAATPAHPDGAAMAVVSTFGLSPDAYDDVRTRWTSWWSQHYGNSAG